MDKFLGYGSTFWTGVGTIAGCVYTIVVIITLWFIYRQVRTAAKAFQLSAIQRLQELIDSFREDRRALFTTFPQELALSPEQFPKRPPGRQKARRLSQGEIRRMTLTEKQTSVLRSLGQEQLELARRVIARLNDIGELVEDGIIDRRVFLGKYHVMVIQCSHVLEAIRRHEENNRSGNYGQRLLRMRHWATVYNDISPKHRDVSISITNGQNRLIVYTSQSPNIFRRMVWTLRRWLSWY